MRAESAGNCADRPAVQRNRVAFWSVSVIGDANDLGRLATDGGFRRRQDTPSLLYRTSVCVSKLTADGGDAGAGSWGEPLGRPWATQQVGKYISTPVAALTSPESTWPNRGAAVSAIHTFCCNLSGAGLSLLGRVGRRRFRIVEESFLIFFVVAPKKEGKNDRANEHRPAKWSCDSANAFSKYVSANSEHRRPDNSPRCIEDEKSQRRQPVCASQQCRKGAQQGDETSEEDNLSAVTVKQIPSQHPLSFVEPDQMSPSGKQ